MLVLVQVGSWRGGIAPGARTVFSSFIDFNLKMLGNTDGHHGELVLNLGSHRPTSSGTRSLVGIWYRNSSLAGSRRRRRRSFNNRGAEGHNFENSNTFSPRVCVTLFRELKQELKRQDEKSDHQSYRISIQLDLVIKIK